mgnify:CR=1 FL=1
MLSIEENDRYDVINEYKFFLYKFQFFFTIDYYIDCFNEIKTSINNGQYLVIG